MTFGAVFHEELLWDFSFGVLGHGIITRLCRNHHQSHVIVENSKLLTRVFEFSID